MNQLTVTPKLLNYLFLFLLLCAFSCQRKSADTDYLGIVNIKVSGDPSAIPHFEKGLLLLHSFEYKDAREAFLVAQEADPEMAMAFWGEAMTYNHSLWREQDYEKAIAALTRLSLIDNSKVETPLEKDFIEAINILYQKEKAKTIRDQEYAEFMHSMTERYPNNHEVAAFYALALLGSVPEGRDEEVYGRGALISKGILKENPKHPGALHYLIHSYDDPSHAHLALDAANNYAKVAPDASHALHMPSHIYVALGMWNEVVTSNEHSYRASLNRMEQKKLDNDARGYHAYHWLEYGYLQQGRVDDARKMVMDMEQYTKEKPSKRARKHLVFLKGTFLAETNLWRDPIADIVVDVSDLNIAIRSQYNFLEGMKAYAKEDVQQLENIIEEIHIDYENEALTAADNGITVCASATRENTKQTDIDESKTMEMQLLALRASLANDFETTEYWLKKSIESEDKLSYSFGPPFIQKPTHELYAAWLVKQNRPEDALVQYEIALKQGPNRSTILTGINTVKSQLGNLSMSKKEAEAES